MSTTTLRPLYDRRSRSKVIIIITSSLSSNSTSIPDIRITVDDVYAAVPLRALPELSSPAHDIVSLYEEDICNFSSNSTVVRDYALKTFRTIDLAESMPTATQSRYQRYSQLHSSGNKYGVLKERIISRTPPMLPINPNDHTQIVSLPERLRVRLAAIPKADKQKLEPGESSDLFIVTGALLERLQRSDIDEPTVSHLWELDTLEKRLGSSYCSAFIPSCENTEFAFEAHLQYIIAQFDRTTDELQGFVVMHDMGGLDAYNETLKDDMRH
ncbi:hypothetical protein BDB00DRAFT_868216 [Zychaea mexicana]|uniref:uncharacterized protein n=1 Tax=Zychaea mexicana TaxID=64656 RepID=UPI0022FDD2DF|nr:uncharacterized protein BDB00DRAFT_868216 [Zychaea mexicana]KAI9497616.1 hypothetical protein BDB00DRAFT_868216 [Zychaea mexicana]